MLLHGDGSAGPVAMGTGAGVSTTVTNFNADASTNNFNVTINGDARSNNFTPYQGTGYYSNFFNTGGYKLSTTGMTQLGSDFTVEFWTYPTSFNDYNNIFDNRTTDADTAGMSFGLTAAGKVYFYTNLTFQITTATSIPLNAWTHLALVRSGSGSGNVKIYINGVADSNTATYTTSFTRTAPSIGDDWNTRSALQYFGYLSNLRATNAALYTSTFTPSTVPLTTTVSSGTCLLLTCQSNRFIDNSASALTMTVTGLPQVTPAVPFTLPSGLTTYGSGYFDGTGDYLSVISATQFDFGSGDFTLECWVFCNNFASDYRFIAKVANIGSFGSWQVLVDTSGYPRFYASSAASSWDVASNLGGGVAIAANTWNYIAVTRSGTTFTIWVNGVSSGTTTSSASIYYSAAVPVTVGGMPDGTRSLLGYITDARILKGTAQYTSAFTPPTTPLTAVTNTSLLTTQFNGGGNNSGFKDSSQNNFVITRNGNTTQGTFAPYAADWSNYFDGSGDYLNVSGATAYGSGSFCFEAWIYSTNVSLQQMVIANATSGGFFVGINVNSSNVLGIGRANVAIDNEVSYTWANNTWYHIAVNRSGTSVQFFVNGVQVGSTGSNSINYSTTGRQIGAELNGTSPFNGYISNLRCVNASVYTSAFTPSTTPLTAITSTTLLTCQSNRFIDNSSNAYTITVAGNTSVQGFSPFAPLTVYNPATYGGSGYFGSANYLSAASNVAFGFGTGDFTVEAWVYPNAAYTTYNYIWATGANDGLVVYVSSGVLYVRAYNVIDLLASSVAPALNAWSHVAVTRSGTTLRIFVNGVQTGTTTNSNNFATGSGLVGNDGTNAAPWYGYISNLRVVKGTAVYTAAFTPPTAPLTAISGTSLLLSTTNAGIFDNAMINDLESIGNVKVSTSLKKYGAASISVDSTGAAAYLTSYNADAIRFGTGDFTIEAWIYPTQYTSDSLICKFVTGGNVFFVMINSGNFVIVTNGYSSPALGYSSFGAVSLNVWTYITLTRVSGTCYGYINGTKSGSSYSFPTSIVPTQVIVGETAADRYIGFIDDFRITKGVARYTATFTAPDQALPNG
jgi:hypothetical protein